MSFFKKLLKKAADMSRNLLPGSQYDIDTHIEKPEDSAGKYAWPYEFVEPYEADKLPYDFTPMYKTVTPMESEVSSPRYEAEKDWRPEWWRDIGDEQVKKNIANGILLTGAFALAAIGLRHAHKILNR